MKTGQKADKPAASRVAKIEGKKLHYLTAGQGPALTTSEATRLGYVIAHELGHMLLGPNAHAIVGIMRGTLRPEDWEKAAQGTLGFTPSQNQQIRTWIDKR